MIILFETILKIRQIFFNLFPYSNLISYGIGIFNNDYAEWINISRIIAPLINESTVKVGLNFLKVTILNSFNITRVMAKGGFIAIKVCFIIIGKVYYFFKESNKKYNVYKLKISEDYNNIEKRISKRKYNFIKYFFLVFIIFILIYFFRCKKTTSKF